MRTHLPKISQLIAFQAVVKYGSINAAAKVLNLAQPSVSRSIKELEDCVNTQLIVRGTLGIKLTPAGESFATHTSMLLETMTRAIDQTYLLSGKTDTLIRFGASIISARSIVRPSLGYLMREFPNCRVHFESGSLDRHIEQLKNGFLDFAIGNGNIMSSLSEFLVEPLFSCPFYIVCAKGNPLEKARHLEDLIDANWWITGHHCVEERQNLEFKTFNLRKSLSTKDFVLGFEMILNHGYIALLSSVQINSFRSSLSVIPIQNFESVGNFVLVRPRNRPLTTACDRFITHLKREAMNYKWNI